MTIHTESSNLPEQEFEELLHNFIRTGNIQIDGPDETACRTRTDTKDQEGETKARPLFRRGQRHGKTYRIPCVPSAASYTFSSMQLSLGPSMVEMTDKFPRLYMDANTAPDEYMDIVFGNLEKDKWKTSGEAGIWLYREGTPQPLLHFAEKPVDGEWMVRMNHECGPLQPGSYFLLFTNMAPSPAEWEVSGLLGGYYCYDFKILTEGDTLPHPRIQALDMTLHRGKAGKDHTAERVSLKPKFATMPDEKDEVMFHCFTEHMVLMDSGTDSLRPRYAWVPGHYFVVAAHNGTPYASLKVKFDGTRFTTCGQQALNASSNESLALHMTEGSNSYSWQHLCLAPRAGAWIRELTECLRLQQFDRTRGKWHLKPCHYYKHYLMETNDYTLVETFAQMAFCCSDIHVTDAAQWIENNARLMSSDSTTDLLDGCWRRTICLYNIGILSTAEGQPLLSRLKDKLRSKSEWSLCLCGTPKQIDVLLESVPDLQPYFPAQNRIRQESASPMQMMHYIQHRLKQHDFFLSDGARTKMTGCLVRAFNDNLIHQWGKAELDLYLKNSLLDNTRKRLQHVTRQDKRTFSTVTAADVVPPAVRTSPQPGFEDSMKELDKLVGLGNLKQRLTTVFNRVRFDGQRKAAGLKNTGKGLSHMIFTGNPGTGKTTVARLMGQACKTLGLLSKGQVVVTERSRLVGRYIGDTERNTLAVLETARGNVLFIDEAYTLYTDKDNRRDFGMRVIDTLLAVLSAPDPDMLVIMAGYEQEMETLLSVNPGLKDRFSCTLHFDDFTPEELTTIALNRLAEMDCLLTPEALHDVRQTMEQAVAHKDRFFGNARWVRKFVDEGLLSALSNRVTTSLNHPTRADLQTIQACDVHVACHMVPPFPTIRAERHIGFRR